MESILTFALKDGQVVHVDDVPNGNKCGCKCPVCKLKLIAKHGKFKRHHFAHQSGEECNHAFETMLHRAAKKVLLEAKQIHLPNLKIEVSAKDVSNKVICKQKQLINRKKPFAIKSAVEERAVQDIQPDIILEIEGQKLFVEVAVTHFIDDEKRQKIKRINISTVEIDLSGLKRGFNWEELKDYILSGYDTQWIYSKKYETLKKEMQRRVEEEVDKRNKVIKFERAKQERLERKQRQKEEAEKNRLKHKATVSLQEYEKFIENISSVRKKYEEEATRHPAWKKVSEELKIDSIRGVPKHLSWIECEYCEEDCVCMFNCDYRLWQALIFTQYYEKDWQLKNKHEFIRDCLELLKAHGIAPQSFYNDISYAVHKGIKVKTKLPRAWDIIGGFVEHLIDIGILDSDDRKWKREFICPITKPAYPFDKWGNFFCKGCKCYKHSDQCSLKRMVNKNIFICNVCGASLEK